MKTILGLIAAITIASFGSFWLLGYLAFGQAKCQGINAFAMTAFVVISLILYTLAIQAIDVMSDWFASRAATKTNNESFKGLSEITRAAVNSQKLIQMQDGQGRQVQGPVGGLQFDQNPPISYLLGEVDET